MKQILFVAAEAAPFAKTGGLGDVVGSLPIQMAQKGLDIRVAIPWYRDIPQKLKNKAKLIAECPVTIGWRQQSAGLWSLKFEGVIFYFVDQPYYFDRSGYYGYFDDAERFAFFSQATLALIEKIEDFNPDIIHAHDWHAALVPLYLEHFYRESQSWQKTKTVFTIHNLSYQGRFSPSIVEDVLGLNWGYFTGDKLEFNGCVNLMKGGILYANAITTVSPTYAEEIKGEKRGEGLDGVLRVVSEKMHGILNGIDYENYNPWKDKNIAANYHRGAQLVNRSENKAFLWKKFEFAGDECAPLIGMVSRLVADKGFDLVCEAIPSILSSGAKLIILGTGEQGYEEHLRYIANLNKQSMAVVTQFNEKLARQIYAGSDIYLMPSVFEPCGISQMIAMRYGSVPIVHQTGGLFDTVKPYNKFTGDGTGFGFYDMTLEGFLSVYNQALEAYGDQRVWRKVMKQAMAEDFSWDISVEKYIGLYNNLLEEV